MAMTYGHRTGYAARPASRPDRPAPGELDPILSRLRRAHGPDLRERPAARGRRPARGRTSARWATASAGGGSRRGRAGVVGLLTGAVGTTHVRGGLLDPTPERRAVAAALGLEARGSGGGGVRRAGGVEPPRGIGGGNRGADVVFQCRGQGVGAEPSVAPAAAPGRPSSTWPAWAARTRCGSARSSTTTAWACAARRSAGAARIDRRLRRGAAVRRGDDRPAARVRRADPQAPRSPPWCRFEQAPELLIDTGGRRRHELQAVIAC